MRTTSFTNAVPAATPGVRRVKPVKPVKLLGWAVEMDTVRDPYEVTVDPFVEHFVIFPQTWAWAKTSDDVITELMHAQAEAVRTMKVTMTHVGQYRPGRAPAKKPVLVQPSGIKALCQDISKLVGDMAAANARGQVSPMETQDFARRYGRYRDAMADLRRTFSEAEGSFETAQELLVAQMTMED